jgi:PAS domain S-box-containing protein
MEPLSLRVLVAEDQRGARDALVASLERAGLEVVGLATDATEAVDVARRTSPDIALIAVTIPGGGVTATEQIVGSIDGCRVLALSDLGDRAAILQMLLAGAGGYLRKSTPSAELASIVQRTARAEVGLSVDVVTSLMGDLLHEIANLSEIGERLRRSEQRFRSLLEAAPDAVIIVDREGKIVLVNQQTEQMFGYARSDLLGRPIEFLVPERFHVAHIAHRLAYLSEPRPRRMGTVPGLAGRRMNATEFPIDISLSTLETDQGTHVIAFVRDLSERERLIELPSYDVAVVHVDAPAPG